MRQLTFALLLFASLHAVAQTTTTSYSCKVIHAGTASIFKGNCVRTFTLQVEQGYPVAGSLNGQSVIQVNDCLYLVNNNLIDIYQVNSRYIYPMPRFPTVPKAVKDSVKLANKLTPPFLTH